MAEQVQSGPQQSRARRFLGAGKRTLDGEDRSERIKTGRKGTPFRAFSPTIKPEFPSFKTASTTEGSQTPRTPWPESDVLVCCSCRLTLIVFQQAAQPLPTPHLFLFSTDSLSRQRE